MKRLVTLAFLTWLLGQPQPAHATWFLDGEAAVVWDDNINFAQLANDIQQDTTFSLAVSPGWGIFLGDRSFLSVALDAGGAVHVNFHGLDNAFVGLTPAFRHKFGLGPTAPSLRLWGTAMRQEYDDKLRDSWVFRLGTGIGRRIGERWELRADYTYEVRDGDDDRRTSSILPGNVFDLTSHTVAFRTDFLFNQVLTFFGGYALRLGDVVSSTRRNRDVLLASEAVAPDPTFGPDFVAYRIPATAHILGVGASLALGQRASVNLSYDYVLGDARDGIEYRKNLARLGLLVSF